MKLLELATQLPLEGLCVRVPSLQTFLPGSDLSDVRCCYVLGLTLTD